MNVIFYDRGESIPAEEFINSLDRNMQARIIYAINTLIEKGKDNIIPFSQYVDEGIFELSVN